ncbi:DDE-type integrase/transposase/recombinase [Pontiella desulfatans]|uniref:DDE-type integrase/transposase/recombinase n=1 Tax=Pontiella desulfatans TaxID=2750659 RepID=UPI00109D75DD
MNQLDTDITYIPCGRIHYLTAVIDWYSRYVLAWELSSTMESTFCVDALSCADAGESGDIQHRPRKPVTSNASPVSC